MSKSIVIIGTLDTKGDQVGYLSSRIAKRGHRTIVIDVGVLGGPTFEPDISRHQIAKAVGMTLEQIIALGVEGQETRSLIKMTDGARETIRGLNNERIIEGVLAVGGSMGTSLALGIMDVLPLGMPKIILSTIANSPAINPDFYANNIIMLPWIGGLWGINEMAKRVLDQAIALISAAAEAYKDILLTSKKVIGISSLGMAAARYLYHLRPALEVRDYEVSVFHATGMNTRLMEKSIEEGVIDIALELFIGQELTQNVMGSAYAPGPHRLEAAIKRKIPMIVSHGNMELANWSPYQGIPEKFADCVQLEHNPLLWMICPRLEDRLAATKILVEKLNRTTGPTAVVLPLEGPVGLTKYGLYDPKGMEAVREELKKNLKPEVKVVEVKGSSDDQPFSEEIVRLIDEMMG